VAASAGQPLEALVKDELRGPVSELVRRIVVELIHEQLNGAAPAPVETRAALSTNGVAPSTKVCTLCGETKPSSAFNAGRRQCRKCRNARYPRSRRARGTATPSTVAMASDEEPPRTSSAESGSEAQRLPD
jgi:recombinational DNA repair protein (RecF pathway)